MGCPGEHEMDGVEVGQVVGVYGRNTVKIAVPEEKLPLVSRHGTYLRLEDVEGRPLYAITVGYYMRDEIYTSAGLIEPPEGYGSLSRSRIELSAKIVGYMEGNFVRKGVESPPRPGSRAYLASEDELREIMGSGHLEIGVLTCSPNVGFTLNLDMLASRHLAILAMTGAGKSNTVAVLLAELLEKVRHPRILVIDTHSEYVPLEKLDGERVRVYAPSGKIEELLKERYGVDPLRLEIPLWSLGFEEVAGLLGLDSRASKQRLLLWNLLHSIRSSEWPDASADDPIFFELERLSSAIDALGKSSSRGGDTKSASDLAFKLRSLLDNPDMDFITRTESDGEIYRQLKEIKEPYRSGRVFLEIYRRMFRPGINIIALGGLPSEVQVSTASTILKALWRIATAYAQAGHAMPIMVFVEEAHVYASASREQPSRQILEKIAKEGRKFGVGLAVVSQRPRELSQTLLAQCGTLIALRTSNPEDQKHIMRSIEDIMEELIDSLAGLSVGEAIVSGPAAPLPAIVKIYHFTEKYGVELGGKDIKWSDAWNREPVDADIVPYLYARARRKRAESESRGLLEYIGG